MNNGIWTIAKYTRFSGLDCLFPCLVWIVRFTIRENDGYIWDILSVAISWLKHFFPQVPIGKNCNVRIWLIIAKFLLEFIKHSEGKLRFINLLQIENFGWNPKWS